MGLTGTVAFPRSANILARQMLESLRFMERSCHCDTATMYRLRNGFYGAMLASSRLCDYEVDKDLNCVIEAHESAQ